MSLSRRNLTEQDVQEALAEADKLEQQYEALRQELENDPRKKQEPRWYVPITKTFRRMNWNRGVAERYELQQREPKLATEVHVLRLGDAALATNRFEYYLDFGQQIKARSPAVQTFIVQLAGPGTYLPTPRAVAGKSYGAVPASTPVGPEGGRNWSNGRSMPFTICGPPQRPPVHRADFTAVAQASRLCYRVRAVKQAFSSAVWGHESSPA